MAPSITVFNRYADEKVAKVINTLEQYCKVLVDSTRNMNEIIDRYKGCNGMFFIHECGEWGYLNICDSEWVAPLFCISFDPNTTISNFQWDALLAFIEDLFKGRKIEDSLLKEIELLIPRVEDITPLQRPLMPVIIENTEYEFNYEIDELYDLCYCQIIKPFVDKPYITIIRNFGVVGFLPMFTAFYICSSWGVTSLDHAFLSHLWTNLSMVAKHGPLNLEERLKTEINNCLPREGHVPNQEPEVYRMTIEELKKVVQIKNKRKVHWNK